MCVCVGGVQVYVCVCGYVCVWGVQVYACVCVYVCVWGVRVYVCWGVRVYALCVCVCQCVPACMSLCAPHMCRCAWRPRVAGGREPPDGFWEQNPVPLQEQPVFSLLL